jgi:hypothetical protein
VRNKDRTQCLCGDFWNVVRDDTALAFNKRHDGLLRRNLALLIARLAADISLVDLDNLILAAERTVLIRTQFAHALANSHRHEPCRLVLDAEHAVQLMGANAFLARCH